MDFTAVGDAIVDRVYATRRSQFGSGLLSVIFRVRGSTTVIVSMRLALAAAEALLAGSLIRSQLNCTAVASNAVPSEKSTFGRSFNVHVVPTSAVVNDVAIRGT